MSVNSFFTLVSSFHLLDGELGVGLGYFDEVTGGVFEERLPDGCAWDVDWVVYFDVVFS